MPAYELEEWLSRYCSSHTVWYVKRLSANDTLANKTHQAGPYIDKAFLFKVLPSLYRPDELNPDKWFNFYIDSDSINKKVRAVWYNGKVLGKNTRNEARITNFGGSDSPILDPESTGSLVVFVFVFNNSNEASECHAWIAKDEIEVNLIEDLTGEVDPGVSKQLYFNQRLAPEKDQASNLDCWLKDNEIPEEWKKNFPSCAEIANKALEINAFRNMPVDDRIIKRRECEFEVFKSLENYYYLPEIKKGIETVDAFLSLAQSALQRRKTRSGTSLELHLASIFEEEGLIRGISFDKQVFSEEKKKPDFIFPNIDAYKNNSFPSQRLRLLAVKTTCKDRWRQVLNEADRIKTKHIFTLQEGISENQYQEMKTAGVKLVVPKSIIKKFPESVKPELINLQDFLAEIHNL